MFYHAFNSYFSCTVSFSGMEVADGGRQGGEVAGAEIKVYGSFPLFLTQDEVEGEGGTVVGKCHTYSSG